MGLPIINEDVSFGSSTSDIAIFEFNTKIDNLVIEIDVKFESGSYAILTIVKGSSIMSIDPEGNFLTEEITSDFATIVKLEESDLYSIILSNPRGSELTKVHLKVSVNRIFGYIFAGLTVIGIITLLIRYVLDKKNWVEEELHVEH